MYIIGIHEVKSFECSSAYRWSLLLIIHFTTTTTKVTNTKTKPAIITKTTIIIFPFRWSRCDPMMGRRALVGAHLQRWTREPTFAISKRPATPTACRPGLSLTLGQSLSGLTLVCSDRGRISISARPASLHALSQSWS